MQKIIVYLLASMLLLSSCGGNSENPAPKLSQGQPTLLSSGSGFEMYTPEKWSQEGEENLPTPYLGELVLSLRSPSKNYGFSHNLIILKKSLETLVNSSQYSIMNNRATKSKYIQYEKIDAYPIRFRDSDSSRVYIFDAKYNNQTPKLRFIQTAKVCGSDVYLLHFAISLNRSPDDYIKLLETFHCK